MGNTIQSAKEFIDKIDETVDESWRTSYDSLAQAFVSYCAACSAPSSIGEDEIQKAAIECLEASTDLTETEQVFVLAGFYEGAKYAIPRLSDRKIVLPSEINGFDYCSSSECVNAFESGYDLAISEIKRLNGIN